ncbi:dermonecrotic toxin domain-containing protein [Pseudomonas sp. UM16]|uniref:dermonecrotic toxin domain-containing protein n=1 Tax=Pseudomonas sp. UM16 TaxID=3158962 RepID=UPI00398FD5E6
MPSSWNVSPHYIAQKLDDPTRREQRVSCFAREWRSSLLFSALAAKVDGSLSEGGLQCVADYCAGRVDRNVPAITLMPLAFKREPTASQADLVHGMYVFFSVQPTTVLLYRPLYAKAPLMEFPSLEAMMVAIRQTGALQDSILDWVAPDARSVYDYGGFSEPHLGRPIIDTSLLPEAVQPASLALQFWGLNVDAKMYSANRDLLVELADRQSVSNTESRWALLTEGAWLLFDVATLLVRGPVATVAWLVQAIRGVQSDFSALTQGNHFEKSLAVVDLILNLGMALFHVHLPRRELPVFVRLPEASDLDGPTRQGPGYDPVALTPTQGKVGLPGALSEQRATQLDFTWRGGNGLNMLAPVQRETLLAMRSAVPLNGLKPLGSGSARGLYLVEGRYYVALAGDTYAVQRSAEGVRVVDGQGHPGPWLSFEWDGWRVDGGLRLRGGMPKSRRQIQEEANRKQLEENREQEAGLAQRHNELAQQFNKLKTFLTAKDAQIEALENEVGQDDLKTAELIDNCSVFYNELATIINNEGVDKLAEAVAIRPESEAEVEQYRHFLVSLEKVVRWETDLVELSRTFDVLLEDTLKDNSIVFKDEAGTKANKNREVGEIIARRRETAVDLDVRLLLDLAELSLDRLASVDASVLEQYHNYLAGESLTSAGTAHGDLAGSGLALAEQIEVLNGIVEAYDETLVLVDYLHTLGGAAIKSDKLQLYKAELSSLKNAAVSELSQAVREQELEMPRLPRPSLYAARGGKRRLVRTQRGRSVLAEEFEVDGVAVVQQRESRTGRVLKQFHQQGNEWVEAVSPPVEEVAPPVASKNPAADRSRARTLIGEVDAVITLAHQYSPDQPLGLSSVIEGHTEKMHETLASLSLSSPDDELSEELDSNIRRLSNARRDMLTSLYLNTKHPTANSLRFLHQERRITIEPTVRRKALSASDFLDVYEIRRLAEHGRAKGDALWEAHFHYPSIDTPAGQFSKGHLKVWWQRKLGREAQLRAAVAGKDLLEIYRSELRLPDVEGIIPFD